ncbi:hypothetical protein [Bacterioplanoides sp.]|uniref:hypothetical protein n=1 Tax=Bacterioplanoides sp. TaxID=2066072 RepID=UPI003B003EE2
MPALAQPVTVSWWQLKEFPATEITLDSDLIKIFPSGLQKISNLTPDFLKTHLTEEQFNSVERSGLFQNINVNINDHPHPERISVGIYDTLSGEKGRFIAIRSENETQIFTHPGITGYSGILIKNQRVRWYKCLDCNDYDLIYWSGRRFIVE